MSKYDESITDTSVWITATPTPMTLTMPFYAAEAGHFYAEPDYLVKREEHDSFLLLYTMNGCGIVQNADTIIKLPENHAVLIDCHKFHRYCSDNGDWEFIWLHLRGNAVITFYELLYPNGIFSVDICSPESFADDLEELIRKLQNIDIINSIELSSGLHEILNTLIKSSLKNEQEKNKSRYYDFVKYAAELIRQRYSESLSIDDMIENIPMSRYHFIRTFKHIMGTSPYNYLTNYRINNAKILLRSTDISVGEIAERCGFLDTSNFIIQFKKHTGQKPLQYRNYFKHSLL